MYSAQWVAIYPEILQKLRTWKFPDSIHIQAKTEELLEQIDKLLWEIIEEKHTFFSALAVWEMTQRYQDWELDQAEAFKNSGLVLFPSIAEKDDESRQWIDWRRRLMPPSVWKVVFMGTFQNFPGELWTGMAIVPAVAIYAVILYFIPTRWQWPVFVLLVLASVVVAVILWNKYHKYKQEAKK